jgi:phasin family protein
LAEAQEAPKNAASRQPKATSALLVATQKIRLYTPRMKSKAAHKEPVMPVKIDDFSAYTDFAKRAFAPATRLNETVVGNLESLVRFQYDLAGDLMQLAIDQMQATVKAKDIGTLVARQSEIASKFVEKTAQRQQSFARIATEAQASVARLVEEATAASRKAA